MYFTVTLSRNILMQNLL